MEKSVSFLGLTSGDKKQPELFSCMGSEAHIIPFRFYLFPEKVASDKQREKRTGEKNEEN